MPLIGINESKCLALDEGSKDLGPDFVGCFVQMVRLMDDGLVLKEKRHGHLNGRAVIASTGDGDHPCWLVKRIDLLGFS